MTLRRTARRPIVVTGYSAPGSGRRVRTVSAPRSDRQLPNGFFNSTFLTVISTTSRPPRPVRPLSVPLSLLVIPSRRVPRRPHDNRRVHRLHDVFYSRRRRSLKGEPGAQPRGTTTRVQAVTKSSALPPSVIIARRHSPRRRGEQRIRIQSKPIRSILPIACAVPCPLVLRVLSTVAVACSRHRPNALLAVRRPRSSRPAVTVVVVVR